MRFYDDAQFTAVWKTLMLPKIDQHIDRINLQLLEEHAKTQRK